IALNAEQVSGMAAKRELPVVWAVAKGSFLNKLILVPLALLISAILPAVITPLLMVGGLFLCYEGAEKIVHSFSGSRHKAKVEGHQQNTAGEPASGPAEPDPAALRAHERTKIKGAIRTDFILSA